MQYFCFRENLRHHDGGERVGGGNVARGLGSAMPGVPTPSTCHCGHSVALGQHVAHHCR